jgi:hypothetical protein
LLDDVGRNRLYDQFAVIGKTWGKDAHELSFAATSWLSALLHVSGEVS